MTLDKHIAVPGVGSYVRKDMRAAEQHDMRVACATVQQLLGPLLMV